MILKMEREYYQEQQDKFVGDINRTDEIEKLNEQTTENKEETVEENSNVSEKN